MAEPMTTAQRASAPWQISFSGEAAKEEAEALWAGLLEAGQHAEPPSPVREKDAELGAGEVILTIVVTAAAKAVISTGLKYLESYLKGRIQGRRAPVKLQLLFKDPEGSGSERFPFSLRTATAEAVEAFIESVRRQVARM